MKLKNFNCIVGILIFFTCSPLVSEDKIDIWNNNKEIINDNDQKEKIEAQDTTSSATSQTIQALEKIEIQNSEK